MAVNATTLKQLREETGAGIVDVKQALEEANGEIETARELLRKRGKQIAQKKASRSAAEGVIGSYVHTNGKTAAFVSLACETDFVARNEEFQALAHDLAIHVAALNPQYLAPADVPEEVVEKEREIAREQLAGEKKPANIIDKILDGKVQKFYDQHCLLRQPFVKDDSLSIAEVIEQATAKIGEKIEIRHFVYFAL